ncbi:unnamed protein product [Staurois parvus]|uniref:C2H2-type domain-containing protein n=1 Tax=Staurois parvus TaxID=386267 RepID=A0ABN9CQQ2_9NEOB|nr:unnamed protein product [Staurois parvus]
MSLRGARSLAPQSPHPAACRWRKQDKHLWSWCPVCTNSFGSLWHEKWQH